MKGKKFIVTSDKFEGEVIYEYNLNGNLVMFNMNISKTAINTAMFFYTKLPYNLNLMEVWLKQSKGFTVKEIPTDLSFERFWSEYGKHGTKSVSKKRYDKLKPAEHLGALVHLPRERDKKKLDGTAMPYAETYLSQKRWE